MNDGFLLSIGRDDAKDLFATKDPSAVAAKIDELLVIDQPSSPAQILELNADWAAIHCVLTGGELSLESGEFPLNHVVLGGRPLYALDDRHIVLVRPDMPDHIATALGELDPAALQANYKAIKPPDGVGEVDQQGWERIAKLLPQIQAFFLAAAQVRHAVVFTTRLN